MSTYHLTITIMIGLALSGQAYGELYRWTDEQGRVHFSDKKTSDKATSYQPKTEISTYKSSTIPQISPGKKDEYVDVPPYEERRNSPDIDRLYAIKFPENPTKHSVAAYIQYIYAISRLQKRHLRSDPQVSLLMQVGEKYLDVLINETNSHVPWSDYGLEAIKKLATEQHKKHILKALKTYSKYIEVVYLNGWHVEIKDELIKGLRNNKGYMPSEWIKAVSEFDRPDARSVLIEYFKYGWNNHSTYNIVSGLKGIDEELNKALPVAWETARENNKHAMAELTSKVLALGYQPAFKFLMLSLVDNADMQKHWYNAHDLALRYTDQTGAPQEILAWYKRNQTKIHFNQEKNIFTTL